MIGSGLLDRLICDWFAMITSHAEVSTKVGSIQSALLRRRSINATITISSWAGNISFLTCALEPPFDLLILEIRRQAFQFALCLAPY